MVTWSNPVEESNQTFIENLEEKIVGMIGDALDLFTEDQRLIGEEKLS